MPTISANNVELNQEDRGDAAAAPILLVMRLGAPVIAWPDAFVRGLVYAGHCVILFDNRDIGRSTRLDGAVVVYPLWALMASRLGLGFPLAIG